MNATYKTVGYVGGNDLPDLTREDLLKLTHINIAFGHVVNDEVATAHIPNLDRLTQLREWHPQVIILLSVGGWGAGGFSEAASTEEGRQAMAVSAVRAIERHGLDGIDLDWEYPCYAEAGIAASKDDRHNFTLLLAAIREALDVKGVEEKRHYLLTIAAGADRYYIDGTEMEAAAAYLDYVQLMTYDMRGGFQTLTGHHTNLYTPSGDLFRISVEESVRLFEQSGVPRSKIVIGAAFYSRMWREVEGGGDGLHRMAGTSGGYGPNYAELASSYIGGDGYVRYWDDEAQAPYLFDGSTFISYDDERSIAAKCQYVMREGLAGIMFWEYGCDKTGTLLAAIHEGWQDGLEPGPGKRP